MNLVFGLWLFNLGRTVCDVMRIKFIILAIKFINEVYDGLGKKDSQRKQDDMVIQKQSWAKKTSW